MPDLTGLDHTNKENNHEKNNSIYQFGTLPAGINSCATGEKNNNSKNKYAIKCRFAKDDGKPATGTTSDGKGCDGKQECK